MWCLTTIQYYLSLCSIASFPHTITFIFKAFSPPNHKFLYAPRKTVLVWLASDVSFLILSDWPTYNDRRARFIVRKDWYDSLNEWSAHLKVSPYTQERKRKRESESMHQMGFHLKNQLRVAADSTRHSQHGFWPASKLVTATKLVSLNAFRYGLCQETKTQEKIQASYTEHFMTCNIFFVLIIQGSCEHGNETARYFLTRWGVTHCFEFRNCFMNPK